MCYYRRLGCTTTETYNLTQLKNLKYQLSNQVTFRVMVAISLNVSIGETQAMYYIHGTRDKLLL